MKKLTLLTLIFGVFILLSCGKKTEKDHSSSTIVGQSNHIEGDSTLYGLACDGCTDTILVMLCDIKGEPDTLNILEASKRHRIFGNLAIGSKVAVVRNEQDSTVADLAICMGSLNGKWCYQVLPTLRRRADMPMISQEKMLRKMPKEIRDSLMSPREYGFEIKGERTIRPVGMYKRNMTSDEESPVEYPRQKRYRDWHLFNGLLILSEVSTDSTGQQHIAHSDTAELVLLHPDTLVLRFKDGERGYYKKEE
jgi:hypothetical protein